MISVYQYFSAGFKSNVTLTFFNGLLSAVEIEPYEASPEVQKAYFIVSEATFLKNCNDHKVKVTELTKEITFEMFYDRYAYKVGKEEAAQAWKKLTKADQQGAYYFIPAYNSRLVTSREARRHPATYLNKKTWR